MKYQEVLDGLQNLIGYKPDVKDIAEILNLKEGTLKQRINRNSKFKSLEFKILQDYYLNKINNNSSTVNDKVEIPYYVNDKLTTNLKNPAITSLWFDRELVENIWHTNPESLRIIVMPGDKMNAGAYPLRKNDVLIMDMSDKDVTNSGIFAFTTHGDSYMYVNGVNRKYDNTYRFYFYNQNYPEKVLTEAEVIKADIKIVGRIIKNLTLTI